MKYSLEVVYSDYQEPLEKSSYQLMHPLIDIRDTFRWIRKAFHIINVIKFSKKNSISLPVNYLGN